MNRLNEIEARANAATEGPWDAFMDRIDHPGKSVFAVAYDVGCDGDAEFIAHARTDVPDMAAALRAVLELHKREESPSGDYCDECFPNEWHWPCSTVATIRQRIGDDL